MQHTLNLFLFSVLFLPLAAFGQAQTYTVSKTPFSSEKCDEFSPVYYKNSIVFCSNRKSNLLIFHSDSLNRGTFKINIIDTTGRKAWGKPKLFSKDLTTSFNDGPVSFNSAGDTIYYSRNLVVEGKESELSGPKNRLGIFYAVKDNNKWVKIMEMRINNEWYNVSTPWLSPDGKSLYFASDKPGGQGGSDLYCSQWKGDYWDNPVNLGPEINTKGNEAYPFINPAGELFFSSDGHSGLGGKDIFYSRIKDGNWLIPVRLDPPINSQYNDFSIITDTLISEGYFASDRDKSIDIYHFRTNFPQIFYTTDQKENKYCFMFRDSGAIVVDTLNLRYVWDFGDGRKVSGASVSHCFPGPGKYNVRLDIVDRANGKLFFSKLSYSVDLRDFEQPYINSPDIVTKGDLIDFDGLKSYLPGYKISNYSWDFGDGTRLQGDIVKHDFKEKGEYLVNLGLTLKSDSTGIIHKTGVTKKILVVDNQLEKGYYQTNISTQNVEYQDIRKYENGVIKTQYSAESDYAQVSVFQVELLSSDIKLGVKNNIFRNVPKKFIIKENFNPDDSIYSYTVDQQMNLMATYPAYKELVALGFKDSRAKILILKDPSEIELHNLILIHGAFAESYFDTFDRLTSNAYIMLDQIVKLMNKYPSIRLEVAVHSDNTLPAANSMALSQKRSQLLVNYLINRGINSKRLIATGYGETKPIAPNFLEKDRKLNRRIDFIIVDGDQ